jgi:hypothetical protein
LEHSKVEAHYSQLECSVLSQLAFAYWTGSLACWAHSHRWLQGCQTQDPDYHLAHSEHCSMRLHLDLLSDC